MTGIALLACFMPSFFAGTKSIVSGFIYSSAREHYILTEKQNGNLRVKVKTPVPVADPHSGMYGGADVFNDPQDKQYITHNSAKAAWYGLESLDGVVRARDTGIIWVSLKEWLSKGKDEERIENAILVSLKEYLSGNKSKTLSYDDLLTLIYEHW